MLRKILKALRAALRSIVRMFDGTWRYVFGAGGGDIVVDDLDPTAPDTLEKTVESVGTTGKSEHLVRTEERRDAALVFAYAGRCQIDGVRPPLALCLPRIVREWLPGLTLHDMKLLTNAGQDGIRTHLREGPYIQGLYRVRRMPPIALETIPGQTINQDGPPRNVESSPALGF